MKTKNLLIVLFVLFNVFVMLGQNDINYTITANHNGTAETIDSISIKNLYSGKNLIFKDLPEGKIYQINLIKGTVEVSTSNSNTTIDNISKNSLFSLVRNNGGKLVVNYNGRTTSPAKISAYSLQGTLLFNQNVTIQPSSHLQISVPYDGISLVAIQTKEGINTFKVLGNKAAHFFDITHIGGISAITTQDKPLFEQKGRNIQKVNNAEITEFDFLQGDLIEIQVYKRDFYSSMEQLKIESNDTIEFKLKTFDETFNQAPTTIEIPSTQEVDLTGYQLVTPDGVFPVNTQSTSGSGVPRFKVSRANKTATEFSTYLPVLKAAGLLIISLVNSCHEAFMITIYNPLTSTGEVNSALINADEAAVSALILQPMFITSTPKMVEMLKSQFRSLEAYTTYKANVAAAIQDIIDRKVCQAIDYTEIDGYNRVIVEYFGKYKMNKNLPQAFIEPKFGWSGNNAQYSLVNTGKRTIHIYASKVNTDPVTGAYVSDPIPLKQAMGNDEMDDLIMLRSDKLNYWKTVSGTFWDGWVNGDMPDYIFKSETGNISVDLSGANKLLLEVWGIGNFHDGFENMSWEEIIRLLTVFVDGGVDDFLAPLIELITTAINEVEPVENGKFDFRYGVRKTAISTLLRKLAEAYFYDENSWKAVKDAILQKNFLPIQKTLLPFILKEIKSDIDAPATQRLEDAKYLNLIYNSLKQATGITKTEIDFRKILKTQFNALWHHLSLAEKTISICETSVDLVGAFAYAFNEQTKTKVVFSQLYEPIEISPEQLQLTPGQTKKIEIKSKGNFSASVAYPNLITVKVTDDNKYIEVTGVEIGANMIVLKNNNPSSTGSLITEALIPISVLSTENDPIMLSTNKLNMTSGQTKNITITQGSGKFQVSSNSPFIISALLKGNEIELYGRGTLGSSTITVTDLITGFKAICNVSLTLLEIPTITTNIISNITSTTATGGGNIISDGNSIVTARGLCWNTTGNPTITNSKTSDGTGLGTFTSTMTALAANTKYYVRAYVTNSTGTYYGETIGFTTGIDNQVGDYGIEMIKVQGGTFMMGSNEGFDDENPVHQVTLSDFQLGKTEVTQDEWKAVMGSDSEYNEYKGSNLPAVVPDHEVQMFISKLNQLTGKQYRLPTEAEWEYAARGGSKTNGYLYSGSNNIDEVAWTSNNSENKPHPVASKVPNELGLYDMTGNVNEMCLDSYSPYSRASHINPVVKDIHTTLGMKVIRGGGYMYDDPFSSRITRRFAMLSGGGSSTLGFRLAIGTDPNVVIALTLNPYGAYLKPNQTAQVTMYSGSGSYSVLSDNPSIATATISGNLISITGVTVGTCHVIVTDEKTLISEVLNVTVTSE